jgi:hypothetical protein
MEMFGYIAVFVATSGGVLAFIGYGGWPEGVPATGQRAQVRTLGSPSKTGSVMAGHASAGER